MGAVTADRDYPFERFHLVERLPELADPRGQAGLEVGDAGRRLDPGP